MDEQIPNKLQLKLVANAPKNATHIIRRKDFYSYANFDGYNYNSCTNKGDAGDMFFIIGEFDWVVVAKLPPLELR